MDSAMYEWFDHLDRQPVLPVLDELIFGVNTFDLRYHPNYSTQVPGIDPGDISVTSVTTTTSHPYSDSPLDPQMKSEYGAVTTFAAMLMTPAPVRMFLGANWLLHEMDNY
jgi:hypothetical protein